MEPILIVVLDLDGVVSSWADINACPDQVRRPDNFEYHPACVAALNWLLRESGAKIVMSTSWRGFHTPAEWTEELRAIGVMAADVIGCTPDLAEGSLIVVAKTRGAEISAWLRDCGLDIKSFVILDDCDDVAPHKSRLIQTSMATGLTMDDARLALRRLQVTL